MPQGVSGNQAPRSRDHEGQRPERPDAGKGAKDRFIMKIHEQTPGSIIAMPAHPSSVEAQPLRAAGSRECCAGC